MSGKLFDNVRKEYIILLIIIVISVSYLLKKDNDKTEINLPELVRIDKKDIKKIEIKNSKGKFVLAKNDNKWKLEQSGFPVMEGKAEKMLELLSDTDISDLISKTGLYERYGLTENNRAVVIAYKDNAKIRELEIGNKAEAGNRTFVKLKGDKNIYQARGDFKNVFDIDKDNIIDKKIFTFYKDDITELIINQGEKKYHFLKVDESELKNGKKKKSEEANDVKKEKKLIWVNADNKAEANNEEIDAYISDNSSLRCESYIEKGKFKNKEITLDIIFIDKNRRNYRLSLYGNLSDIKNINKITATSPDRGFLFIMSKDRIEKLLKNFKTFVSKKSDKTSEKKKP